MSNVYDLIVIGGGPGGYVAAIRAAQLGSSVAVIEKRNALGGTCLNEGCIPSKALLDSSELFVQARDKFAGHGILVDPPSLDLGKMMQRKEEIITRLTRGIASLFKKNKITLVTGTGRLGAPSTDGSQQLLQQPKQGSRPCRASASCWRPAASPSTSPACPRTASRLARPVTPLATTRSRSIWS